MYATCTFCHRALGGNESIEVFPVGRRLAFDAARGRLWVVCPSCHRWNLTPLEERWEAIEQGERLFRDSRLRHSTDNIGLARLRDGTELIRVGRPLRPEMAAWRYGENFARRRKGLLIGAGIGGATVAASALLLPAGVLAGISGGFIAAAAIAAQRYQFGGKVAFMGRHVLDNEHQYVLVSPKILREVRLIAHPSGWALRVPYLSRGPALESRWRDALDIGSMGVVTISGPEASAAARQLLPLINGFGARAATVQHAVALASTWTNASEGFAHTLSRTREIFLKQIMGDMGSLSHLPPPMRLALEMSLHEDVEQRALEGELAELERVWREAEIVAGIADGLLLPGSVSDGVDELKRRS